MGRSLYLITAQPPKMIKPAIPIDEEFRLKQLWDYAVLDSVPEADFDFITSIASQICESSISLISLVDENRQWFKSCHGLDIEETDRDVSFCAHAINNPKEVLIINDAHQDERFFDNPLVTGEPYIRFYAGVPLISEEGYALGTLCVLDKEPKELTELQLSNLKSLAKQVMNLLELRKNTRDLERALNHLKFKNKELEEFTYITSHDLQEPVRTIVSLIEMISESYHEKLDEQGLEMMDYVIAAGYRMKALILGLLDYSRLGRKREVTLIDCNELIDEVIQDLTASINECNAKIEVPDLPKIRGFRTELRLLFQNLISNAIKFRQKDQSPEIDITFSDEKKHWKFCVSDNGIGIPSSKKTQIFKIFQRLHSRVEYEGYGLGLTHSRKIIELHHGKIWVNSELNNGSKFYFTIPKSI